MTSDKRGLLFSTRATTGREGKYVSRHMCIIQSQCGIIDHLNQNITEHTKENIEKYSLLKINQSLDIFTNFYVTQGKHMSSWEEVYNSLDVSSLEKYDYLYLFAGIDLDSSNMTRFGNRVGVFPKDSGQMKFESHGKIFTNILAMLKAHKLYNIPIHEYQYDTGEISLTLFHKDFTPDAKLYSSYYNHDIEEYGIKRMDSLQYYFNKLDEKNKDYNSIFSTEKDFDFAFAFTVLRTSGRKNYTDFITEVSKCFNKSKLYTKNHFTGVDTSIDSDLYSEIIERSHFTMILPAYDRKSFAIDRFITALHSDCLPLIHPDANYQVIEKSYDVSLQDLLLDSPSKAATFTNDKRDALLSFYKNKFLKFENPLTSF